MLLQLKDKVINNKDSSSISSRLRKRRFHRFLEACKVTGESTILDVGGCDETWDKSPFRTNVTLLNLSFPTDGDHGNTVHITGNALNMDMFGENRFDVVFSNSVIEHIGTPEEQFRFACEIQRVGKSYWVQTPSRHFPIEPHFLFPFFQFLPRKIQRQIAVNWKHSYFKYWNIENNRILKELELIHLLDKQELLSLFEGASLYEEKILGITKSLSVYKCAG